MTIPTLSFLPLFLLLLFSTTFTLSSSMDCNKIDRAVLLSIKQQLGNPSELAAWLPATNCCTWFNVYCTDTGRVNGVYLSSLNVSSPLPPALGNLPELTGIQIEIMPGLFGPIPTSFSKLSHLEYLQISGTSVSGSIPAFLTHTNLGVLVLTNNKLSGPIPKALSGLSNLRYLDLSGNSLSGSIPPGLLHQKSRFLMLSNNKLTGEIPRDYSNGDIDTIDLSHNRLTGNPSFLFGIAKPMTKIDLSWNELEFDMTHVMFPFHLTYLDLSHNRIKGRVAKSLKDLKLSNFNVSYNELCGEIPTGRYMAGHGADCYLHNKCLCGTPLPPCSGGN
ncbi:polygalacturonase inhibitor 2-like [Typha latifolia]|uniref:polygalacturonase inhibitor 2-like n=1 Tax=Typha latifolia TaxID=4733 RepID=UPI003C2D6B43